MCTKRSGARAPLLASSLPRSYALLDARRLREAVRGGGIEDVHVVGADGKPELLARPHPHPWLQARRRAFGLGALRDERAGDLQVDKLLVAEMLPHVHPPRER